MRKSTVPTRVVYTSMRGVSAYDESQVIIPIGIGVKVTAEGYGDSAIIRVETMTPCISNVHVGRTFEAKDGVTRKQIDGLCKKKALKLAADCKKAAQELMEHYRYFKALAESEDVQVTSLVEAFKRNAENASKVRPGHASDQVSRSGAQPKTASTRSKVPVAAKGRPRSKAEMKAALSKI